MASWLGKTFVVAVAYLLAGRVALQLAIPPGYATAAWPAAGIALMACLAWGPRVSPGVVVGSFFVNIWTSFDGDAVGTSVAIAACIGAGAALQAIAAAALVQRLIGQPNIVTRERDIGLFLLLAGPVACLVSATIGTATLFAAGFLDREQLPFSWWTWWVGDTIGVLIVAPLVLLWTGQPVIQRRRRRWIVASLLVCAGLVIAVFVYASHREERSIEAGFTLRVDALSDAIRRDLVAYEETVHSIRSYLEATGEVDRSSFRKLVARALDRHTGIQALSWNPRVLGREREQFEEAARRGGMPSFRINDLTPDGQLVPAIAKPEHFPVYFIEPTRGNEDARGLDITSEPTRTVALDRARSSRSLTVTGRVRLVQDPTRGESVLAFLPVYRSAPQLDGFVVGAFRVAVMIESALRDIDQQGIDVEVLDADGANRVPLCALRSGRPSEPSVSGALVVETAVMFGERRWLLRFAPTPTFAVAHRSWQAWAVLAVGLLFTSLLGAFVLIVFGRAVAVEQLVAEKTASLSRSEARVRRIIESAPDAMTIVDQRGRIVLVNARTEALFRYASVELLGQPLELLLPERFRTGHVDKRTAYFAAPNARAMGDGRKLHGRRKDGTEFPVEISLSPLPTDDGLLVSSTIRDVTVMKEAERRILASLAEKEVLLKEVHHRVKNNLQVISSLLNLQARRLDEPRSRRMFEESQARVQSIALVHEKLYRSHDLAHIDLGDYVRSLVEYLTDLQNGSERRIRIETVFEPVELSIDRAIPCGLILTELVTNAFEHAFPDDRAGTVAISIRSDGDRIELGVRDDGVGLPGSVDPRNTPSLGLDLVATLALQIDAEMIVERGVGTAFRLVFHHD